jgi:CRISPR-associated protein Csd1
MILQALKEYYERIGTDERSRVPKGFERKSFPFLIVINRTGDFINLEHTREGQNASNFLVPRSKSMSGKLSFRVTNLLWDHTGYVLGKPESDRSRSQHETWMSQLNNLAIEFQEFKPLRAILNFYTKRGIEKVTGHPEWRECARIPSCNIAFKIADHYLPVPCLEEVSKIMEKQDSYPPGDEKPKRALRRCLVTGNTDEIVRVHNDTRIGKDSKKLVSFQKNSGYDSYGKEQGFIAPVGKVAEFAYTTALNTLLKSNSRMLVGDAVTVFWSEKTTEFENLIADFFREPPKDDPNRGIQAVKSLFRAIENGVFLSEENRRNRFYVLGLSPNVARIAVRFWVVDTVAGIGQKIKRHFDDLRMVHGPAEREVLSLFRLLVCTAAQDKAENTPPNMAGDAVRAILEGTPYPQTLLQAAIRRIRAKREITHPRAALIKACINRTTRFKNPAVEEELKMSLDENNTSIGYRLGRLFAVLEKIQQEANPGINATIRDRFYGAASGTPATVFGNLMRLKNHHLSKLTSQGRRINFEKLLGEILAGIPAAAGFPAHLGLEEQGRFAIGYYHQQQNFFVRKQ